MIAEAILSFIVVILSFAYFRKRRRNAQLERLILDYRRTLANQEATIAQLYHRPPVRLPVIPARNWPLMTLHRN